MITLLTTADKQQWQKVLPMSANVFGSVEYARIHEEHSPSLEARLFIWSSNTHKIAYPFFLRPISILPFTSNKAGWDITTPEYTGPVWRQGKIDDTHLSFAQDFSTYCREHDIVAEFAHLYPWVLSHDKILPASSINTDREIVYVDLELSEEQLWSKSFTHACRKNIRRARKESVRVFPATTLDHIRDFYQIYTQTMKRNHAQERYYYPFEFFQAFYENMSEHAQFMMAAYEDEIIAGTLYLHDDDNVYSYLGGANHAFQRVRPTNLIISEAITWSQKLNKKRLVLGGGYSNNDGIFRFKSSFSPYRALFKSYKQIHQDEDYKFLCESWSRYYQTEINSNEYFPAYRAIVKKREE